MWRRPNLLRMNLVGSICKRLVSADHLRAGPIYREANCSDDGTKQNFCRQSGRTDPDLFVAALPTVLGEVGALWQDRALLLHAGVRQMPCVDMLYAACLEF